MGKKRRGKEKEGRKQEEIGKGKGERKIGERIGEKEIGKKEGEREWEKGERIIWKGKGRRRFLKK